MTSADHTTTSPTPSPPAKPDQPLSSLTWTEGANGQAQGYVDEWARKLRSASEKTALAKDSEVVSTRHVIAASGAILVKQTFDRSAVGDVLMAVGSLLAGLCAGFLITMGLSANDVRRGVPIWFYAVSIAVLALSVGVMACGVTLKLRTSPDS